MFDALSLDVNPLSIADNLSLPLDFVTERIAFLARTGAGKSGGMRVLFEAFLEAKQFAIFVDPKGDAWGVRAAGVGPGYPVLVMGGDHGDVPLEATAGKVIAEFLVRERVSTVLDISDFGKSDMVRFVKDLATTLYQRNRDVVHVFLDEGDMVAGEKFYDPKCLEAIQLIQNKGRHRGFGVTVATQRSAMINKTVLYASGTLVAMQTTSPKDIKTVRDWLEVVSTPDVAKEIVSALPTLKTREALIYSPQYLGHEPRRITFKTFRTFDSMRTPRPGETRQQPKSLADIDLTLIQRDMAATIEKAKASDPKELNKTIAQLRGEIHRLGTTKPAVEPKFIEKHIMAVRAINRLEQLLEKAASIPVAVEEIRAAIKESKELNAANLITEPIVEARPAHRLDEIAGHPKHIRREPASRPVATSNGDFRPSRKQQEILDALAWFESIGNSQPSGLQVGAVALIDASGGHFSNVVGPLSANGLIERGSGQIWLTDIGRTYARVPENIATLEEYHDVLRHRVRKVKRASGRTVDILDVVIEAAGNPVTTQEIGTKVGIDSTGGHFSNTIGPLSTLGLIQRSGGLVRPTKILFPQGLL